MELLDYRFAGQRLALQHGPGLATSGDAARLGARATKWAVDGGGGSPMVPLILAAHKAVVGRATTDRFAGWQPAPQGIGVECRCGMQERWRENAVG